MAFSFLCMVPTRLKDDFEWPFLNVNLFEFGDSIKKILLPVKNINDDARVSISVDDLNGLPSDYDNAIAHLIVIIDLTMSTKALLLLLHSLP